MGLQLPNGDTHVSYATHLPEATSGTATKSSGKSSLAASKSHKHLKVAGLVAFGILVAMLVGFLRLCRKDEGYTTKQHLTAVAISDEVDCIEDPSSLGEPTVADPSVDTGTHPEFVKESSVDSQEFLKFSNGPFDVSFPLFSQRLTEGYSSEKEAKDDLKELGKFLLNAVVASNTGNANHDPGLDLEINVTSPVGPAETPVFDEAQDIGAPVGGGGNVASVNAYETNSQEFTIDRADFVKSDGNLLFAAYSDYLVVFATDGQGIINQVQMTPVDVTAFGGWWGPLMEGVPAEPSSSANESTASARSAIMPGWIPKPRIEALLIHNDRLTVVVSGYGIEYTQLLGRPPALYEYLNTRIQVYDINKGNLLLISETNVNGNFLNAYSNGEFVYIVTRSTINTWDYVVAPMQRYQPAFQGLDDDQYWDAVSKLVAEGLLDRFVDDLITELEVSGPVDLARLSVFTDSIAAEDQADEDFYNGGLATSVSQVVSFDMTSLQSGEDDETIEPHIAAIFHPGYWGHVYAMGSMIIVADQGWSWVEEENRAVEKTYLICFSLSGASSSHSLVGNVHGYLLNSFSLDYVDKPEGSYVRVVTTENLWAPWAWIEEEDQVVEMMEPESSTVNHLTVLKVPSGSTGTLEFVGRVKLGEPNERLTSVRFFRDFAYAVTFERTDPFYVIDLSQEQPKTSGELKVSGFSEYLHPIDREDKLLLSIGHEADENGLILGYQVSLFDASVVAEPRLVDRLVVENRANSWSSSSASWDERAFRFLPLGDEMGKLIIPLSIYTENPQSQNFEGFTVFNIENGTITKDFDIDHSLEVKNDILCNRWFEWLPERSFVFDGNVVTMKKHTIISTSLSSGETLWNIPIDGSLHDCQVP